MGPLLTQAAKLGEHDRIINVRVSKEVVRESFVLDHHLWHGASNGKHRHLPGPRMPARDCWPPGRTVRRSKSASLLHRVRRCGHGPINSAELYRVRPCGHSPIDSAELYRLRIESRFHSLPRRHVIIISFGQLQLYCNLRDKTLSGTHQKKTPPKDLLTKFCRWRAFNRKTPDLAVNPTTTSLLHKLQLIACNWEARRLQ